MPGTARNCEAMYTSTETTPAPNPRTAARVHCSCLPKESRMTAPAIAANIGAPSSSPRLAGPAGRGPPATAMAVREPASATAATARPAAALRAARRCDSCSAARRRSRAATLRPSSATSAPADPADQGAPSSSTSASSRPWRSRRHPQFGAGAERVGRVAAQLRVIGAVRIDAADDGDRGAVRHAGSPFPGGRQTPMAMACRSFIQSSIWGRILTASKCAAPDCTCTCTSQWTS